MQNGSKTGSNIIAFLVIMIGIGLGVVLVIMAGRENADTEIFNDKKAIEGKNMYTSLMSLNDENYPMTPEETVEMYGNGYLLIYGNMLKDHSHIMEILIQQRRLLSEELLESNPIEVQYALLEEYLNDFEKDSFYIVSFETMPAIYKMKNNSQARVRVKMMGNEFSDLYWNYYLQKDKNDEVWRIIGWKAADENYNDYEETEFSEDEENQ